MATAKICGPEDQCFITNSNREEILELNCRVLQLNHKLQCCSARAKGDGNTTCLGTGEVTPDQMRFVIEELENSIRKLRDEFSKHLADIQHLRGRRGRGMQATLRAQGVDERMTDVHYYYYFAVTFHVVGLGE